MNTKQPKPRRKRPPQLRRRCELRRRRTSIPQDGVGQAKHGGAGRSHDGAARWRSHGQIVLDRSPDNIQEDYGRLSMHEAGRGSYGVRHATLARKGVVRFEDVMPALAGCIAGGVTAKGADPEKPRLYAADMTNTTLDLATIEEGDNINV